MVYLELENFDDGEGTMTFAVSATPSAQSLTSAYKGPTVLGAGLAIQTTSQALTISVNSPTYTYDFVTKPSALSLTLGASTPSVTTGDAVAPNAQTLALTQNTPTLVTLKVVNPSALSLTSAQNTPGIEGMANVSVSSQNLTLTEKDPAFPISETILVDALGLNLTQNSPNYIVGDGITPATLTLTSSVKNPTISIYNPNVLQSDLIYKNAVPVTQAKLTIISTTASTNFIPYLSNNNGSTWESVTLGTTHIFSDPTGEEVKYKIYASPGSVLSKVTVKVN